MNKPSNQEDITRDPAVSSRSALRREYVDPGHRAGPVSRQTTALAALVVIVLFTDKAVEVLGTDSGILFGVAAVLAVVGALAGALFHPVRRFWWRGAISGVVIAGGAFTARWLYGRLRPEPFSIEFAVVFVIGAVPGVALYYALMRGRIVGPDRGCRHTDLGVDGSSDERGTLLHGGYYDCYVLVSSRSPVLVQRFLDQFVPVREEMADEYEVPQYATSPCCVFHTAGELLHHLADHPNERHAVYWRSSGKGNAKQAMVFPTADGAIIFGLSCAPEDGIAGRLLAEMKAFLASDVGAFWFETPAPHSAAEFVRKVKARWNPGLPVP